MEGCGINTKIYQIMENKITHGKPLSYWKANAEEDYLKVPISVLKYITILEEELEQSSITAVVQVKPEKVRYCSCVMPIPDINVGKYCDNCGNHLKHF